MQHPVLPLQQLVQDGCTQKHTNRDKSVHFRKYFVEERLLLLLHDQQGALCSHSFNSLTAELTFNLLLRSSGVARSSRCAHIVSVDVLQEHLGIPPSQRARLKHIKTYLKASMKNLFCITASSAGPHVSKQQELLFNLQEGFFLLQVLADQGQQVLTLYRTPKFVMAATPVFISPILLLQALQHTAHLQGCKAAVWNITDRTHKLGQGGKILSLPALMFCRRPQRH